MFGRIALDLTNDRTHPLRLDLTVQLAKEHNAELVGIYSSPVSNQYLRDNSMVPSQVASLMSNYISAEAADIRDNFLKTAADAGIRASYRAPQGPTEDVLAMHARYCDILVMSQTDNADSIVGARPTMVESVITSAGRPVLVVPYIGHLNPIGKRVLFCWDNGRRAARALADAAPILQNAKHFVVLKVDENLEQIRTQDITPQDLDAYCAAKGYPAPEVIKKESLTYGIGNTILNAATDNGCDMIVMGAYNRSRIREWILGGTSRTLLQSMTVPILFSH